VERTLRRARIAPARVAVSQRGLRPVGSCDNSSA
jgi:hypothetical protein